MFGLDEIISGLGQGATPTVVLGVAVLLGLRHVWGAGHATSLLALGGDRVRRRLLSASPVLGVCALLFGLVYAGLAIGSAA